MTSKPYFFLISARGTLLNVFRPYPARMRSWHERKVEGFLCESTHSAGAMGPAWYIAGKLAWNPKADERALFEEFLEPERPSKSAIG